MADDPGRKILENPFRVLELTPTATRGEVEREAAKWLGMLELGHAGAGSYATPLGPRQRTAELVRWAAAELRDPERRLAHELWVRMGDGIDAAALQEEAQRPRDGEEPWLGAFRAIGWGAP